MINTSNEYKRYIADSVDSTLSREFVTKADITLADGTVLNVTDADIVKNGLKISDVISPNNSFQICSAIINQCNIMLNNIGGKFDQYDFADAIIRPYIGLKLSQTTEWLKKGIFTVDEPTLASSIISLVALDNMNKFDTEFSNVTQMFPCTALQLLQSVCLHCGVPLATSSFLNSGFMIQRRPSDEATTCREIVVWIGQISGNFARCNIDGALELKWYDFGAFESSDTLDGGTFDSSTPYASGDSADGGNFTDYNSGDNVDGGTFLDMDRYHHFYALNQAKIGTDDVVITGVEVKAMGTESDYGETVLFGSKGYVIRIDENPLIMENTAGIIANSVGAKIVGMRFRPLSISTLSDPSVEAGDVAYVSDKKSNSYQIIVSNVSYTVGNPMSISCDAETPSKKQSVRFDAQTKAIVKSRKFTNDKLNAYDLAVQRMTNLVAHAFGLHETTKTLEDGSEIFYKHDKPTLAESSYIYQENSNGFFISNDGGVTWNSGWDADGNAVMNVLSAIGVNAEWIKVLTSFTVGDFFSVDARGKLKAINADISGKITADSGKIGPYLIDESGIESDVIRITDNPLFPGIRVQKRGDSDGLIADKDNDSRESYFQSGYVIFESINDGVKTQVRVVSKSDYFTSTPGLVIAKIDVSGATEKAISYIELTTDEGTFLRMTNNSSDGLIENHVELSGEHLNFYDNLGFGASIVRNERSLMVNSDDDVYINGGSWNNILQRLDELEQRL